MKSWTHFKMAALAKTGDIVQTWRAGSRSQHGAVVKAAGRLSCLFQSLSVSTLTEELRFLSSPPNVSLKHAEKVKKELQQGGDVQRTS